MKSAGVTAAAGGAAETRRDFVADHDGQRDLRP
jgi:hypothetical protein